VKKLFGLFLVCLTLISITACSGGAKKPEEAFLDELSHCITEEYKTNKLDFKNMQSTSQYEYKKLSKYVFDENGNRRYEEWSDISFFVLAEMYLGILEKEPSYIGYLDKMQYLGFFVKIYGLEFDKKYCDEIKKHIQVYYDAHDLLSSY
jgi:hypothetical protein